MCCIPFPRGASLECEICLYGVVVEASKLHIQDLTPSWWLRNRHIQSCLPALFPEKLKSLIRWEELTLPDDDFIELAWAGKSDAPIVILLPGLEGNIRSHYIRLALNTLVSNNFQVVVMHYRSCGRRINRLAKSYNSFDYADFSCVLEMLITRLPNLPLHTIGFSLGGNLLLHYLHDHPDARIESAMTVSTPFEMYSTVDSMQNFYQRFLLNSMKKKALSKIDFGISMPCSASRIKKLNDLREFDNCITAPIYGFSSAQEYYQAASCRSLLKNISHPTLMLHAMDDPFIPKRSVPTADELSSSINLERYQWGGHVGFMAQYRPGQPNSWLGAKFLRWCGAHLRKP